MNLLTIAGTDPTGAAGITADLRVFRDFGAMGLSTITAVVWQNSQGVRGFRALEPNEVAAQLDAVLDDIPIHGVKIGMVATSAIANVISSRISGLKIPVVFDPVMASGTGETSLWGEHINALENLLKCVDVLTPNIPEAEKLLGEKIHFENIETQAIALATRYNTCVLLKVGHLPEHEDSLRDVWASPTTCLRLNPLPRFPDDVRGTGCALSSAILANVKFATDRSVFSFPPASIETARAYLSKRLAARIKPGHGRFMLG